MGRIILAMLVVLGVLAVGARSPLAAQPERLDVQFAVNGVGRVTLEPDFAVLAFSIETIGTTAQAAIRDNAARVEVLLKHLREVARPGDRIETAGFRLAAQRRGYVVVNQVQVRTLQMKEIGAIIDVAARGGADDVAMVAIGREHTRQAAQQAVREAMQRARETADAVAAGLGMRVGRIVSIEPTVEHVEGPLAMPVAADTLRAMRSSSEPTIMPGLLTLTARVHMRFVLAP
ncbi:MAG: SIMPL domain-containing protein [Armatimonadetes bacterium]|nr:SIMPL domain-containing protein [Armatimonadota bacterium]